MKEIFTRISTFGSTVSGIYPAGRGEPENLVVLVHSPHDYGVWWTGTWRSAGEAAPALRNKGHECIFHPCPLINQRTRFTAWWVLK